MTQSTIKFGIIYSKKLRDEGFVMLSNNVECKVVGICIVKVNILNQITKNLDSMRDVTEIEKKNLISLGYQIFLYMDILQEVVMNESLRVLYR